MAMNEIVNTITNTSVTFAMLAYLVYKDLHFSNDLKDALTEMDRTVSLVKDIVIAKGGETERTVT